jgi:hypothetical protein
MRGIGIGGSTVLKYLFEARSCCTNELIVDGASFGF